MKRFAIAAALTLTLLGTGNAVLAAPVVPLQTDELESGKFADANGWDPRWVDRQNGFYRMIKAGAGDTAYVMETVFTGGKLPANPDAKSAVNTFRIQCGARKIAYTGVTFYADRYGKGAALASKTYPESWVGTDPGSVASVLIDLKCSK